jgi:hypothetical protein
MRLLQFDENDEFSLTDDLINNIQPYAILSHTWEEDHEEVSFIDLTRGPRRTNAGYKKLRFCAKQAAHDSLRLEVQIYTKSVNSTKITQNCFRK